MVPSAVKVSSHTSIVVSSHLEPLNMCGYFKILSGIAPGNVSAVLVREELPSGLLQGCRQWNGQACCKLSPGPASLQPRQQQQYGCAALDLTVLLPLQAGGRASKADKSCRIFRGEATDSREHHGGARCTAAAARSSSGDAGGARGSPRRAASRCRGHEGTIPRSSGCIGDAAGHCTGTQLM
jgi:hypothetical protein